MLDNEEKNAMALKLKEYTKFVIEKAWPQQQEGIVPVGANAITNSFKLQLKQYNPISERDKIIYESVINQYNNFYEKRRMRLNGINVGLPASIYWILILGLMINILISWLIKVDNRRLEIFISTFTGILAGSLVFLIVSMDNPFRGEFSVSAAPFQNLLDTFMQ
jgi:hypothetical protein